MGGFQVYVNGAPSGHAMTLVIPGLPLVLQIIVPITPTQIPATVQVEATGLDVTLSSGESAAITIIRVQ